MFTNRPIKITYLGRVYFRHKFKHPKQSMTGGLMCLDYVILRNYLWSLFWRTKLDSTFFYETKMNICPFSFVT